MKDDKDWGLSSDVAAVVEDIVHRWHPGLARARIVSLMRPDCPTSRGKEQWAAMRKATPAERAMLDGAADYVLIVALDVWTKLPAPQRLALIDHELCHAGGQNLDTGEWTMEPHDLEEFVAVIDRHGAWRSDVEQFLRAAQRVALPQMTLDEIERPS